MNIHIIVNGRRWFNKSKGHTYHSVSVKVIENGITEIFSGRVDYEYGYGTAYNDTALRLLKENHFFQNLPKGKSLWAICRDNGWLFTDNVADVKRKCDL